MTSTQRNHHAMTYNGPPPSGEPVNPYTSGQQQAYEYPAPAPRADHRKPPGRQWGLLVTGLIVGAALTAGGFLLPHSGGAAPTGKTSPHAGSNTIPVSGAFTLTDTDVAPSSDGCSGTGGYGDITDGAEVVISDDSGATLAITELSSGRAADLGCEWDFNTTVPRGKGFYGVTVTHRGTIKFTEAQIGEPQISLGN